MTKQHLVKSNDNRVIFGVLGGFGEFFGWSRDTVTLVRIIYAILVFASASGLFWIYIIAGIVMPREERTIKTDRKIKEAEPFHSSDSVDDENWKDF